MELQLIWRMVKRWWWLMLLPPLLTTALTIPRLLNSVTGVGGFTTSFKYSAAQDKSNIETRDGDYQDVWLASELAINAFTEWLTSSTFRAELATALGTDIDLAPLSIVADNARSIGVVYLSYSNGPQLAQIAEAAITVLQTKNAIYFPHLGGVNATVTLVDAPIVVPAPPPLTNRFEPFIRIALAALAGIGLAALFEYSDTRVRDADDIERLGVRVLHKIPKS